MKALKTTRQDWSIGLYCDCCGDSVDDAVAVGGEPGYGTVTVYMCKACLLEAVEVMG